MGFDYREFARATADGTVAALPALDGQQRG
jgi:hypothetical protein